jgi:uncharacterized paraquat-inducible protein A
MSLALDPTQTRLCRECSARFTVTWTQRTRHAFCSPRCQSKHWRRKNPR